jgi:transcriptional regulator with XRE-family HTH domain
MRQDVRKRFGARLRKLRVERGWTQEEFAERLGIDRSYIGQVERGTRNISLVNLELIADGFGMTLSGLFSRV